MLDPRVTKLAELICSHSVSLSAEDNLLIHAFDIPEEVVAEFVRVAQNCGASVLVRLQSNLVQRQILRGLTDKSVKLIAETEKFEMEHVSAYISLRGTTNLSEFSDVSPANNGLWSKEYATPVVFGVRVPRTKWVALRWPSPSFAQQAGKSTVEFEEFYFNVCTVDYGQMERAAEPLRELMDRTDRVRLVGPGTDVTFSIKGVGAVSCFGRRNIPDGECFSAPVKDSVNGTVQYNTVSLYQGTDYSDIRFVIKDGRIFDATAGANTEKINKVLDTDEGARYFGEWSLGYNPNVLHPMRDTLFDEKIAGSFHFTPGNSYDPPGGNGNVSAIHWDLVCIQRPEYGGGEVYFDDVLIRKDGLFVVPELMGLNPDQFHSK